MVLNQENSYKLTLKKPFLYRDLKNTTPGLRDPDTEEDLPTLKFLGIESPGCPVEGGN